MQSKIWNQAEASKILRDFFEKIESLYIYDKRILSGIDWPEYEHHIDLAFSGESMEYLEQVLGDVVAQAVAFVREKQPTHNPFTFD